jgi:hypothetical protein
MAYGRGRLPNRFPVGTKLVIEGKRGGEGQIQVFSRYLEFPDGTFFSAAARQAHVAAGSSARQTLTVTWPLNPPSANDRGRVQGSLANYRLGNWWRRAD